MKKKHAMLAVTDVNLNYIIAAQKIKEKGMGGRENTGYER